MDRSKRRCSKQRFVKRNVASVGEKCISDHSSSRYISTYPGDQILHIFFSYSLLIQAYILCFSSHKLAIHNCHIPNLMMHQNREFPLTWTPEKIFIWTRRIIIGGKKERWEKKMIFLITFKELSNRVVFSFSQPIESNTL